MGTEGMRGSLVSREVIADSIELFVMSHLLDGVVALSGCDKTIPGCAMALARLDVPGVMLYGGPTAPGVFEGKDVTIQDVFEAVGAHAAGRMSTERLTVLENPRVPRRGACGGQYTANTIRSRSAARAPRRWAPARSRRGSSQARGARRAVIMNDRPDRRPSQLLTRAVRQRDRRRRRDRGLDQRGAPPARDLREVGVPLAITTACERAARTPVLSISSRAAGSPRSTWRAPAGCGCSRGACSRRASWSTRRPAPAARSATRPRAPSRPPARRCFAR
jgi:hypothetical protein